MTMNLMLATPGDNAHDAAWEEICAHSLNGYIFLDNKTVDLVAAELENVQLSNGQFVCAYPSEEGDPNPALICSFGPALLPATKLEAIRSILAAKPGAAELLDFIVSKNLQIRFRGESHLLAHMAAANVAAEEVEINMGEGNMLQMIADLGLGLYNGAGEVPFDRFVQAVNDNGHLARYPTDQLHSFIAYGKGRNAIAVCWA